MVRDGTEKDIPRIIEMSREFWQKTDFKDVEFEPDMVDTMSRKCIDDGLMVVLESRGKIEGFACGIKNYLLASSKAVVGTELAWWVDPKCRTGRNGINLLLELEKKAKKEGVRFWNMVFMESSMPEEIEGIYKRMGYRICETVYMKELS
jgi:L-amino acid N-acyltransferase YncA